MLSNIFISLCAVSLVFQTYILFGEGIYFDGFLSLIFFSTLFIYNNHRRIAFKQARIFTNATFNNYSFYKKATLAAFIGLTVSLFFCDFKEIFWMLPLGFISVFYSVPLLKQNRVFIRLREIPMLKIFLIAAVWGIATVVLPIVNINKNVFSCEVLLLVLRRMIFIFALTIPFDIRDSSADAKGNIKTLPHVLGNKKSQNVALIGLLIFFLLVIYEYILRSYHFYFTVAFFISTLVTAVLITKKNPKNKLYHYYFALDGMMMLQFILVLLASYI